MGPGKVSLRGVEPSDRSLLEPIFAHDEVRRWWGSPRALAEAMESSPDCTPFAVLLDGEVVGFLQICEEADPEYRHAGIDLVIDPERRGQGIGPEAIRLAARHAFGALGHHRLVIDPNLANVAAIRAYEKVGFRRVGVMRQYEWSHHLGEWTDGLLMELLADDFDQSA